MPLSQTLHTLLRAKGAILEKKQINYLHLIVCHGANDLLHGT